MFEPVLESGNPPNHNSPTEGSDQVRRVTLPHLVASKKEVLGSPDGVRLLTEIEKSWLAGVIDGEGSILIVKLTGGSAAKSRRGYTYVPIINLSSSSETFARKVREIIGKGSVNFVREKRLDWKDKWYYRGASMVLRGLLPQLLSHLLVKKEVAERMLQYLAFVDANPIDGPMAIPQGYYEKVDSLYLAVKRSNEKGKDVSEEVLAEMLALPRSLKNRGPGSRATDCRKMTEEECAWLAGIIDGEGSVFLSKVNHPAYRRGFFYRPQIEVSNSNRSLLTQLMGIIGEGSVQLAKKGGNGWRTRWQYIGASGVLRAVLPQILPYLIVKRETANTILEYYRYIDENPVRKGKEVSERYYERLDSLYWKIKTMNAKGKSSQEIGTIIS